MTPTFLLKEGRLLAVLGSPGGPTIITTVLQTLIHIIDHGMSLEQSIGAPRLHHPWMPDEVYAEHTTLTGKERVQLEAMGHRFSAAAGRAGEEWGDAEGILLEPKSGVRIGVTDPRSADAGAVGY